MGRCSVTLITLYVYGMILEIGIPGYVGILTMSITMI